jgi:hypothetical protein
MADAVYLLKIKTNDMVNLERVKFRYKIFGRLIYSSLSPCYYSGGLLDSIKHIKVGGAVVCENKFHIPPEMKDRVKFVKVDRKFNFQGAMTGRDYFRNKAYLQGLDIRNLNAVRLGADAVEE